MKEMATAIDFNHALPEVYLESTRIRPWNLPNVRTHIVHKSRIVR